MKHYAVSKKNLILAAILIPLLVVGTFIAGMKVGENNEKQIKESENELYYQLGRENFIMELNDIMDNEYIHRDGVQIGKRIEDCISDDYFIIIKNTKEGYVINTDY